MKQNADGFTLIELLVAIAVFTVIVSLVISSKLQQTEQGISQQQAVEMQQTARSVISLMITQLRRAGYNPHYKDYRPGITSADTTALTFSYVASDDGSDNDGDGDTDEDGELCVVTYAVQDDNSDGDNDITINFNGGGAQLLAENISSFAFTYFDETGTTIGVPVSSTNLERIRSVGIDITVQVDAQQLDRTPATNNTRRLSTRVFPRNLGF